MIESVEELRYELPGLAAMAVHERAAKLATLSRLLAKGEKLDRLERVLGDSRWMRDRFTDGGFRYDGYVDDLAEGQAAAERRIVAARPDAPRRTADALWFALLRGSVASLAAAYDPKAVRRAIDTGLWSARRAAGVVSRVADARRRLELCLLLLDGDVPDPAVRAELELEAVGAALDHDYEHEREEALVELAPRLHGDAWRRAFEVALAAGSGHVLAALAHAVERERLGTCARPAGRRR